MKTAADSVRLIPRAATVRDRSRRTRALPTTGRPTLAGRTWMSNGGQPERRKRSTAGPLRRSIVMDSGHSRRLRRRAATYRVVESNPGSERGSGGYWNRTAPSSQMHVNGPVYGGSQGSYSRPQLDMRQPIVRSPSYGGGSNGGYRGAPSYGGSRGVPSYGGSHNVPSYGGSHGGSSGGGHVSAPSGGGHSSGGGGGHASSGGGGHSSGGGGGHSSGGHH